jgi:hypothetical protein
MTSKVVRKPTGALKDYLDATKHQTRLMGAVERHVLSQPESDRAWDVLHPSAIVKDDWCHRGSWFALSGFQPKDKKPNLRLQNIFDEGHAIHDKWQSRFRDMGALKGRWECLICSHYWYDVSPEICPVCDDLALIKYREVPLRSKRHRIAGHADGWVTGIGNDTLIEVKSVGAGTIRMENPGLLYDSDTEEQAWRGIKRPFPTHLRQGQVYLHLGHLMVKNGLLESFPDEMVFIYEWKANQDFKEFVIGYEPSFVANIFSFALDIVEAVDAGVPPVCNLNAKGCKQCIGLEVPVEER